MRRRYQPPDFSKEREALKHIPRPNPSLIPKKRSYSRPLPGADADGWFRMNDDNGDYLRDIMSVSGNLPQNKHAVDQNPRIPKNQRASDIGSHLDPYDQPVAKSNFRQSTNVYSQQRGRSAFAKRQRSYSPPKNPRPTKRSKTSYSFDYRPWLANTVRNTASRGFHHVRRHASNYLRNYASYHIKRHLSNAFDSFVRSAPAYLNKLFFN